MTLSAARITPCLWFAEETEEAATFYTGVFPDSRIMRMSRYSSEGVEIQWQVVPRMMDEFFTDPESDRAKRAMAAMLKMKEDRAELERAARGP